MDVDILRLARNRDCTRGCTEVIFLGHPTFVLKNRGEIANEEVVSFFSISFLVDQ